jgi:hypothetical protein
MTLKSKIILRILLTFLIGAVLGAVLDRVVIRRHIRSLFRMGPGILMAPFQDEILSHVPPEARSAVERILEAHGRRLAEIRGRSRDEIEASFQTLLKDLSPYLTPEKIREIEQFIAPPFPFEDGPPKKPRFGKFPPPGFPDPRR